MQHFFFETLSIKEKYGSFLNSFHEEVKRSKRKLEQIKIK